MPRSGNQIDNGDKGENSVTSLYGHVIPYKYTRNIHQGQPIW